jgi:hypothetical protein
MNNSFLYFFSAFEAPPACRYEVAPSFVKTEMNIDSLISIDTFRVRSQKSNPKALYLVAVFN